MADGTEDIDPELLQETGRASAIQDLAAQARSMGDRSAALEIAVNNALGAQLKRWRRTAVALGFAIAVLLFNSTRNSQSLSSLSKAQHKLDELVTFVHTVQGQQQQSSNGTSAAVQAIFEIRTVLCADPKNADICAQLIGATPAN